jgi:prepilin-type N-terminal cleavage/methylation domain-containing protein
MNYINKLREKSGFTLVELLIVIAVIAILAIAVLAALDPIEQLKKSRDSGRLADARELYSAYTRYYASFECYPGEHSGSNCIMDTEFSWVQADQGLVAADITELITAGELKTVFSSKDSLSDLRVNQDVGDNIAVCYSPESKSGRSGGMGDVLTTSFTPGSCPTTLNGWSATCVVCVR